MTDMTRLGQSGMTGSTPVVRLRACEDYVELESPLFYVRKAGQGGG